MDPWSRYFIEFRKKTNSLPKHVQRMVEASSIKRVQSASDKARKRITVLCDWRRVLRLVLTARGLAASDGKRTWSSFSVESLVDKHRACEHVTLHNTGVGEDCEQFWTQILAMEETVRLNLDAWSGFLIHDFTLVDLDLVDALVHSNQSVKDDADAEPYIVWRMSPDLSGRLERAVLARPDREPERERRQTSQPVSETVLRPATKEGTHVVLQLVPIFSTQYTTLAQKVEPGPERHELAVIVGKSLLRRYDSDDE
jgi:hypothetical protein